MSKPLCVGCSVDVRQRAEQPTDLLANGLAQLLAAYSVGRPAGDHQVPIPGRLIMKGIPDIVVKKSSHVPGIALSRNGNMLHCKPTSKCEDTMPHLTP